MRIALKPALMAGWILYIHAGPVVGWACIFDNGLRLQ